MMTNSHKPIALLLSLAMILSLLLSACGQAVSVTTTEPGTEPPTAPPAAVEYCEPLQEGYNQVIFYWNGSNNYENCDVWAWWDGKDGKGYRFHECAYGGKAVIQVPEGISQVGFIVRKDCSDPGGSSWGSAAKDYEQDRFAVMEGRQTEIYLKPGNGSQYQSNDGGKTLNMIQNFTLAGITDSNEIQYKISPKATISSLDQVKVYEGNRELQIESISSLGKESANGYIRLTEDLDLSKHYRVFINGYGEKDVVPTDIFDSQYFADHFHYDGSDLGAVISGENTTFKVWAPTASKVVLNLFAAGNDTDAYQNIEMVKGEKGVWSHTENCGHGTYYTYTVTTSIGTQEAVDPYAKAVGLNGDRGMVVDLSLTDPDGFDNDTLAHPISSYSDAIIWEVHVRDFSNQIASSQYKGKYLAFTEAGLTNEHGMPVGIDYLKELGITHVHLLPVYDYATVNEAESKEFNWGYDPQNYNAPEGSYSTDPYHGEVRINEFKQMVMALHNAGIGVVMDMVYNHTYDGNSSFNKIVPYYYYRYTATGANSSASGCGNDTASERYMFGKFMVDSTAYWVDEYHLDGLRFDLMGLHDLDTMQNVERAVHTINPNAILYGEGWTMGATIDGSLQANQTNIGKIIPTGDAIGGIAVFNDVIRDGLKGSVFEKDSRGFISGEAGSTLSDIVFGIKGGQSGGKGWTVPNSMVINYMSAHDNNTLWDKLLLSNPDSSDDQRNKMNNLGAAIIMLSKGTPFWQAGEEMLRTKDGDENSYKSDDSINNLNWSVLKEDSREYATMLYYKGLIQMRKTYHIFRSNDTQILEVNELGSGVIGITFDDGQGGQALAVINAYNTALPYTLEAPWNLIVDGNHAGAQVLAQESGNITLDAISIRIYVNDTLVN